MENRKGTRVHLAKRPALFLPITQFLIPIFLVACGAPGEPTPPSPVVPAAIADLIARQDGDGVRLSFTLPSSAVGDGKLASPPAVEIFRGALRSDGAPDSKSFRMVYTIPGALIDNYRFDGHMHFTDPITPEETKSHPGGLVAYVVRTRASQKRASADSNAVSLRVFPVPERIPSVEARVTESAIELNWPVPTRTSGGDPLPAVTGYRIYRLEIAASAGSSLAPVRPQGKSESASLPPASSETNSYRDTTFAFDRTYVYIVRSMIQVEGSELESSESQPVTVTPHDTFPPAAPQGLVVALLPGPTSGTYVADLSWAISLETDLAGYRVYRNEQESTRGQLLNPELLPTPAIRDTSVQPGHRYWYSVTAVDHAGNESAPSAPAAIDVTPP
jgi:hypothetical protein